MGDLKEAPELSYMQTAPQFFENFPLILNTLV